MSRWWALLPLVGLVALAVLFAGWSLRRDPQFKPDAQVGRSLPSVVLPRLDATAPAVDLAALSDGRPMVVNLFASWCAPCRIEHPQLMAMQAQGFRVVGIAYKDDPAATDRFLQELGDPFDIVLVDRDGRAGLELGVSGVPETFVVGPDGRVTDKLAGPIVDAAQARELLATLQPPR